MSLCAAQLRSQPRSQSFKCEFTWCSCHWHVKKNSKKVSITVLVFSVSPTQSCYATRTQAWQFCNEPKLKPSWGSFFLPSESSLLVEKWVTSTLKAIVGRHKKCCISNVRTPPTSWTETEGVSLMTTQPLLEPTGEQYRPETWATHISQTSLHSNTPVAPGVCLTNVFKHVRNVTHLCLCVSLCACASLHIWVPPWRGVLDESSSNLWRLLLPMFWTCRLSDSRI